MTVDWVVVTAACVGLAIALLTIVGGATQDHSELLSSTMSQKSIPNY